MTAWSIIDPSTLRTRPTAKTDSSCFLLQGPSILSSYPTAKTDGSSKLFAAPLYPIHPARAQNGRFCFGVFSWAGVDRMPLLLFIPTFRRHLLSSDGTATTLPECVARFHSSFKTSRACVGRRPALGQNRPLVSPDVPRPALFAPAQCHSCRGLRHSCPGLRHSCPGLRHSCPGLRHSCPGLFHSCPGLCHSCPVTQPFRRVARRKCQSPRKWVGDSVGIVPPPRSSRLGARFFRPVGHRFGRGARPFLSLPCHSGPPRNRFFPPRAGVLRHSVGLFQRNVEPVEHDGRFDWAWKPTGGRKAAVHCAIGRIPSM